jgi:hypothetical protein
MIDGIYHVRFSSSTQDFGEGLATIKDGSVNGGDNGYLYQGRVSSAASGISGKLLVKRWNPSVTSVFGNMQQFELDLSGSQSADRTFQVSGNVAGQSNLKINIAGRFLAELA